MSIVLGLPLHDLLALVLRKGDLKSMFCLIVFSIVVLILAYLTNPTENSFRSYLTEQSFRHHLSRLDDNADDNNPRIDRIRSLTSPKNKSASAVSSSIFSPQNWPSFHFANRASISLRTPKHVFHSFGIFTIAAMLPTTKASERESRDASMISDSWYVGAFGRWWRGGVFEEWYQDVIAGPKDEESWTSGILNMKRLDMLQDYKVPTFSANNLPAHLAPGSPPRLRNRERSTLRNDSIRRRNTTPPPLPKSASLPMHTARSGSRVYDSSRLRQQKSPINSENATRVPAPPSRPSSTSFEQSPAIAEVLRQISSAKTSVAELRAQLTECQNGASQSRSVLQNEVDAHRERKRQEDASKAELKTRTKNFEDSKRHAEGLKKEADKKLKLAQTSQDDATGRMKSLGSGIDQLQEQLAQDLEFISSRKGQVAEEERIIPSAIERKRQEIKVAEVHVHALNHRSRELEEKLSSRKEKLRILREKIEQYNERRSGVNPVQQQHFFHSQDLWLVGADDSRQPLALSPLSPVQHNERVWKTQLDSFSVQQPSPPTISTVPLEEHVTALDNNGFSPFSDSSLFESYASDMHRPAQSYIAQEFVSVGLGTAFEEDMSRSFKSDSDPYHDTNYWSVPYLNGKLDGSPLTTSSASTDDVHLSPFSRSDYGSGPHSPSAQRMSSTHKSRLRGSSLSSKGLNPDAKEFNFSPLSNTFNSGGTHNSSVACKSSPPRYTYDALNPSGIPSTTTTTQESLLRAFALSPAEREALQRTSGGLSNRSFERLPSLSDVGSIPSSPTGNGHGLPSLVASSSGDFGSRLPAWLQSLPRNRKVTVNFSPWDDEEPQGVNDSRKS